MIMSSAKNNTRCLYLIPVSLGGAEAKKVLPPLTIEIINSIKYFVVENQRTARRFLISAGYNYPVSEIKMFDLNEHTGIENISDIFDVTGEENIGLLSEAGVPSC